MKKYNKKFDSGFTLSGSGKECEKDCPMLEACGSVDELSCFLGLARAFLKSRELGNVLECVQKDLILIMGDLACETKKLKKSHVKGLEGLILRHEKKAESGWAVPGSSRAEAALHAARAVCRRAERRVLSARKAGEVNFEALRYLNRLSDLLFALAMAAGKEGS